MEKLTVIIPVYNEVDTVEAALLSVDFADHILIVDSHSTDGTIELAGKYTDVILKRSFDSHSSQKNWAIEQAETEWILILDADERVTPGLKQEILQILANPPSEISGFWIYRDNHFMGKKVNYSGWQNDKVLRLFKKSECRYNTKRVHEEIVTEGKVAFLQNRIEHYTYKSLDNYIAKLNRYAYWQALDYDGQTNRLTPYHFVVKPGWRFFKHYVIQQGFRDGVVGFTISFLQSYAILMRYIKLWLYRRGQK